MRVYGFEFPPMGKFDYIGRKAIFKGAMSRSWMLESC
jgi:hypothetical protein